MEHPEWLRVLFLLTVDLLRQRNFKNGKSSFSILLDTMSSSVCDLAEKVQLYLVFSQGKHFAEICL